MNEVEKIIIIEVQTVNKKNINMKIEDMTEMNTKIQKDTEVIHQEEDEAGTFNILYY